MADLLFIAVIIGSFALFSAVVRGCEAIVDSGSITSDGRTDRTRVDEVDTAADAGASR